MADVDRLFDELSRGYTRAGGKMLFVSIVPTDGPIPDAAVRKYMIANWGRVREYCAAAYQFFEGSGVMLSLKRTALRGMALAAGMRDFLRVHDRLDDLARSASDIVHMPAPEIVDLLSPASRAWS